MSVYLYRLYAVQSFNEEKVGVYVFDGNFPDVELLQDAQRIVDGETTRKDILERKNWFYGLEDSFPNNGSIMRKELTYYTRGLKRAKKIISENDNVDRAIFVNSTNKREWHGEHILYHNRLFEEYKSDTPEYTGCKEIGTIKI